MQYGQPSNLWSQAAPRQRGQRKAFRRVGWVTTGHQIDMTWE